MNVLDHRAQAAASAAQTPDLQRRELLTLGVGLAAATIVPIASAAPTSESKNATTLSPALHRYARMMGGRDGEDVLWWFAEELYLHTPGEALVPLCRPVALGVVRGLGGSGHDYRYQYREASIPIDIETAQPLTRNPLTGAKIETPVRPATPIVIEWHEQADGTIAKKSPDWTTTSHQRWTIGNDTALLLETEPGQDAFAMASGDAAAQKVEVQSMHSYSARRKDLDGTGFVPAQWMYTITTKTAPDWLGLNDGRDHRLLVRGLGTKSRVHDIVNPDSLAWVRKFFPGFL